MPGCRDAQIYENMQRNSAAKTLFASPRGVRAPHTRCRSLILRARFRHRPAARQSPRCDFPQKPLNECTGDFARVEDTRTPEQIAMARRLDREVRQTGRTGEPMGDAAPLDARCIRTRPTDRLTAPRAPHRAP